MSLQMKQSNQSQHMFTDIPNAVMNAQASDELIIHSKSSYDHPSPMSTEMKKEVNQNGASLQELFKETLKSKGELPKAKIQELGGNEIEVKGVSKTTLHSFILEAEKLGKQINFTNTYTVKISD